MTRRLMQVLPFALPLAGLGILFLVGKAVYQDRLDQVPLAAMHAPLSFEPSDQLVPVKVERLPTVDIERLPPIEVEVEVSQFVEVAVKQHAVPESLLASLTPSFGAISPPFKEEQVVLDEPKQVEPLVEILPFASDSDEIVAKIDREILQLPPMVEPGVIDEQPEIATSSITTFESESAEPIEVANPAQLTVSDDQWQELPDLDSLPEPEFNTFSPTLDDEPAPRPSFANTLPNEVDVTAPSSDVSEPALAGSTSILDFEAQEYPEAEYAAAEPTLQLESSAGLEDLAPQNIAPQNIAPQNIAPQHVAPQVVDAGPNGWSPVDIRSIKMDKEVAENRAPTVAQASPEGKRQSETAVRLGFELVQRGAPYSARARFIEALRVVARSLDDRNASSSHTAALRRALAAYHEAGDFFPKSTRPDQDVRPDFLIGGHTTDVLKSADVQKMTPGRCVREYVAYAEQEFAKALGEEEIASRALYGLGRLEWSTATTTSRATQVRTYRSMSLYQAAIVVNRQNFAAANELGVLLARHGKYDAAISALSHSVKHSPQPTAWRNLANLYRRVGNIDQAQRAEFEATRAAARPTGMPYAVGNPKIEWVEPNRFAGISTGQGNLRVAQVPAKKVVEPIRVDIAEKQTASRRPWPFGRSIAR